MAIASNTAAAISQLEAALTSPSIPPRAAKSCALLVEKLRRPVRVGIFGLRASDARGLLVAILGEDPLVSERAWPTVEFTFAEDTKTTATLSDGSTLVENALPGEDLMRREPVFLSIAAPIQSLERMSFLCVNAIDDHAEQMAALSWAARRTDIAIWCTLQFDPAEEGLWATAPDDLKNHAFLVTMAPDAGKVQRPSSMRADFDAVFAVPLAVDAAQTAGVSETKGLDRLLKRLASDIDEALSADVDAARLFLHRFGHLSNSADENGPGKEDKDRDRDRHRPDIDLVALISDPILYLKRRTRGLLETLEWPDEASGDWASAVLSHCGETAEGLRERAANWPEDDRRVVKLQQSLEEACDMAVLLEIEGGKDQAEDAATMLLQLREEFECALAA